MSKNKDQKRKEQLAPRIARPQVAEHDCGIQKSGEGMTTKRTNTDMLKGLVAAGMKMRYGDKPEKEVKLRILWELKHIIDADFVDYYVIAFWIFRHMAQTMNIGVWGRGAMPSSIVCHCLGLSEIDPLRYGLHSERFVNDNPPKFQFDVETSRFDEFIKSAENILPANTKDVDVESVCKSLMQDLTPMEYLSRKRERPLPENIDDELNRYALRFPETMALYETYIKQPSDFDGLIYQEQMLEELKRTFDISPIKANHIRLAIQRGEAEKVEAYKQAFCNEVSALNRQSLELSDDELHTENSADNLPLVEMKNVNV